MFEVRAIRESEREECLEFWCTVFPGDQNEAYFRRYFYGDVEWLPYYTQVGVLDGKIVSAAHICKRVVACGEYTLTMGGLANVSTLAEHRGKGYNTQCVKQAVQIMEADAMDFSLLGTGINAYYERVGYATWPTFCGSGVIRVDFDPDLPAIEVRPASASEAPILREFYRQYNRTRPITVRRDASYWREWIGVSEAGIPDAFRIALKNDVPIGYVKTEPFRTESREEPSADGTRVVELCISDDAPADTILSLLAAAAKESIGAGRRVLQLEVGDEAVVEEAANRLLTDYRVAAANDKMTRLLHRENLLRGFAPLWNERWIANGRPHGVMVFQTPYGPVRIDAEGALLRIETTDETTGAMPQSSLFGLLFGTLAPDEATDRPGLWPLMETLFSTQSGVYSELDGF